MNYSSELHEAALDYARDSFKIIPLKPGGKEPLTAHGYKDATCDLEVIDEWWTLTYPGANIGIAVESIGLVVDFDPRNYTTAVRELQVIEDLGLDADTTQVMTGGGGYHFWYRLPSGPEGFRRTKLFELSGIDLLAGSGYIVAPPSTHPSGDIYRFNTNRGPGRMKFVKVGSDAYHRILSLATIRPAGGLPPVSTNRRVLHPAPGDALKRVADKLRKLDPDMDRSQWLRVGMAIHSEEWLEGFALFRDWSAGLLWGGEAVKFDREDCRRVWESFKPNGAIGLGTLFAMDNDWDDEEPEKEEEIDSHALFIYGDELDEPLPRNEWLIKKIVPRGRSMGMFFGDSGAYKSFLSMDMGLSVASGVEWAGHRTYSTGVVVLVNEGLTGARKRVKAWERKYGLCASKLPFALTRQNVGLINPASAAAFQDSVESLPFKPGLFIIDTLAGSFEGGDENRQEDMTTFTANVRRFIMEPFNAGCLIIHHTGHGAKDRARGSTVLPYGNDYNYQIKREESLERHTAMVCKKMKDDELPADMVFELQIIELGQDEDNEMVTSLVPYYREGMTTGKSEMTPIQREVLNAITRADPVEGHIRRVSKDDVRRRCYELWDDMDKNTQKQRFSRAIKALERDGVIGTGDGYIELTESPVE